MATFNKNLVLLGGLGLGLLSTISPAAAQCHGGHSGGHSHGGSHGGSVRHAGDDNRWGLQLGWLLALDGQKTLYNGPLLESNYFVGAHLQVGGRVAFTMSAATPTNFGYEATGPIISFAHIGPTLRYMLGDNQRWRLDALGGAGLNSYNLADNDRQVTNKCGCTSAASVAYSTRPMFDAGLGLTYKLWRELWLTSNLRYAQVLGSAPFGSAALQSQWQLSMALTLPSSFVPKTASK